MPDRSRPRVILTGASNLTRAVSTVVETARLVLDSPVEILAAIGHGRAYGLRSRLLVRELPPIVECGLWRALDEADAPADGSYALVTDIGNDILFGASVEDVIGQVETTVVRLLSAGAHVVVTDLPVKSAARVGPARFRVMKTLLFPWSPATYESVMEATEALATELAALGERYGLELKPQPPEWFGLDPIHIRMGRWAEAWASILGSWRPGAPGVAAAPSLARWLRLRRGTAERWRLLGRERRAEQPAVALPDGTTVSYF